MEDREMNYTAAQHERELTRIEIQAKRWFIAFLIVLCMLFVLFGTMTLSRVIRKSAITKDISAMEQSIQETERKNADLALEVAEARDMARIGYDAAHKLQMIAASKAETVAVHAPDTRPFGEEPAAASGGMKTGSR